MAARGRRRLVALCAGIGIGVLATRLSRAPEPDPARAEYLESRRERMRVARRELVVETSEQRPC